MPYLQPIFLSLLLAAITTIILLVISIPLAYWLAYGRSKVSPIVEMIITLPLVLPPTVLGFYLLIAMGPGTAFGQWLDNSFGIRLVFSFGGLVLGSIVYSLPFMVHPIRSGFANLPKSLVEASDTMGKSRFTCARKVLLPNCLPAVITGTILAFAHTLGEFGVVLMIGGSIPGKTRVASIAIFEAVEQMEYGTANLYSLILIAICLLILVPIYLSNRRRINALAS